MVYIEEHDLDPMINSFHIGDELKDNKEIQGYLRRNYNKNRPIITKKKFEEIWYVFKEDCISLRLSIELYEIMEKIMKNMEKVIKIEL